MSLSINKIQSYDSVLAMSEKNQKISKEHANASQKILCAMLTNQVPGSETNMGEMMQMFMSSMNTETQAESNKLLAQNLQLNHAMFATTMNQFQGQSVEHNGKTFDYQGGHQEIFYTKPEYAKSMTVHIFDKNNKSLYSKNITNTDGAFHWDGYDSLGNKVENDFYRIECEMHDKNNNLIEDPSAVRLKTKVTSIQFDKNNLPILMGGKSPIGDIISCEKISPMNYRPFLSQNRTVNLTI